MASELEILIGRLNPFCRRGLELAAGLCVSQTNYNVEVEHLLVQLLDLPAIDLPPILHHYELDAGRLTAELNRAIETFDRGNSRTPAMSPQVLRLLREAWMHTTLHLQTGTIRSAAIFLALLGDEGLRGPILESCPPLAAIPRDSLQQSIRRLIRNSVEETPGDRAPAAESPRLPSPPAADARQEPEPPPSAGASESPALDRYTLDLIAEARAGRIDPVSERERELRQVIDILSRRRQNNPILVGEAGVGKTAIAEGLALAVAAGEVPEPLQQISLRLLDLGLLEAGAGVKGEFERRLKSVIAEVQAAARPVILFIDEAHNLIGAGGSEGRGDAANLLKPALAAGELRTIAATTWSEYKKYFEKDPALARRFQPVEVEEPGEEAAVSMLRGLVENLERHHGVRILDGAVREAVRLSRRYLPERRLPAKAVSLLDTASARVALAQRGTPTVVEDVVRSIRRIELERRILEREPPPEAADGARIRRLAEELERLEARRLELAARWEQEQQVVERMRDLERRWAEARSAGDGEADLAEEFERLEDERGSVQGEEPLVPLFVDPAVVAQVVSGWTGIPVGRMQRDEIHGLLTLRERMTERIVGQGEALGVICRRIRTARAGLEDPRKPKGVFLLVGPTGVGKTETAFALAELLFGGERNMVALNMSEFQESHSVATLKGAPPGYVGYGEGGVLTEAVRRKPYCVLLLDEVEKAHRDVVEIFYQVFDKGMLEDGEGVPVDFKNAVILLTANLGGQTILEACSESSRRPGVEELVERLRPRLLDHFSPALLGRLEVVPFFPLGASEIRRIVELKLAAVQERVRRNHLAELTFDPTLVEVLAARCLESDAGARRIDSILNQSLLPELSTRILGRMVQGQVFSRVRITVDEEGNFV